MNNQVDLQELIDGAKDKGYTIRTVDVPGAKTFGQLRIGSSKVKNGPDQWMNETNVTLRKIQSK